MGDGPIRQRVALRVLGPVYDRVMLCGAFSLSWVFYGMGRSLTHAVRQRVEYS